MSEIRWSIGELARAACWPVGPAVGRWDALGTRFHPPGEQGQWTAEAARRTWRENSDEVGESLPWPTEDLTALVDYLTRARQAR